MSRNVPHNFHPVLFIASLRYSW